MTQARTHSSLYPSAHSTGADRSAALQPRIAPLHAEPQKPLLQFKRRRLRWAIIATLFFVAQYALGTAAHHHVITANAAFSLMAFTLIASLGFMALAITEEIEP